MKKKTGDIVVFVFSMLFIASGFLTGSLEKMVQTVRTGENSFLNRDAQEGEAISDTIETAVKDSLFYHDWLLDLNSAKENILGGRISEKPDMTVVKTDSGKLAFFQEEQSREEISSNASYFERLKTIAEENGSAFLCCPIPQKGNFETAPVNVSNYNRQNYERTFQELQDRGIPALDVYEVFQESSVPEDELYFDSDHHLKPRTGFLVYRAICERLHDQYGFQNIQPYLDLESFATQTYKNWFLGALGKKAGRFFSWRGADDFELITPVFETDFTEEIPYQNQVRRGSFSEILIYQKNLEKNYYHINNYQAYNGGDYRLQIIRNNRLKDGPVIVVVRSSYACVVTPFLALQAGELHLIDDRPGFYPEGEPVDVEAYVKEIKPDYVLAIEGLT